jgi:hypothetical protein
MSITACNIRVSQNINPQTILSFQKKLQSLQWTTSTQTIDFEAHSDQVGGSATFLFAINDNFYANLSQKSKVHIRATPPTPNGFQSIIYEPFNSSSYCIPINDEHCKIVTLNDRNPRHPSVASTIAIGSDSLSSLGHQIYDRDYPAPLPSSNQAGFFGPLFGVTFVDPTSNNTLIRAISIAEYISTFGYNASFNTIICQTLQNPIILRQQSIPARIMTAVANCVQEILASPMHTLLCEQAERYDIDLSVPALFNGIITTELPNDEAWTQAYQNDKGCKQIMEMLDNPSLITTTRLQSIDPIYRSALRDSHVRMNENRLCLFEPIASSTKQL